MLRNLIKMINLIIILIVSITIEGVTLFCRYTLKQKASETIHKRLWKKFGFKKVFYMHHLFTGLIIAVIFYYLKSPFLFNIGIGIALSDLIHHTILKIIEGSFEFKIIEKI